MNICDIKHQNKILEVMDDYFYDLEDISDFKMSDLEQEITSQLNIKFNFGLVSDNKPILDKIVKEVNELTNNAPGVALDILSEIPKVTPPRSNFLSNISSFTIDDLFHSSPSAKSDFDNYIRSMILGHGLLKRGNIVGIKTDEDVTQNFMDVKNNLFKNIQDFLRHNGLFSEQTQELYSEGVPNYDHYVKVMKTVHDYFFDSGLVPTRKSYTGKTIVELPNNINENRNLLEAYYNTVLLSNFDSVIRSKFSSMFNVNINKFNILETNLNLDKYSTSFNTESTLYWKPDDHSSDSAEKGTAKLTKEIVSIIPLYSKRNNLTNNFMGPNDLYLLGSKIASFELRYGNKYLNDQQQALQDPKWVPENGILFQYFNDGSLDRFKWYISSIINAIQNKEGLYAKDLRTEFKVIYDKILSLDHFINDNPYDIDDVTMNSLLTLFTQEINNTYGAVYGMYDSDGTHTIQDIYKEDFNSTRVQNSAYSHLKINYGNIFDNDSNSFTTDFQQRFNIVKAKLDEYEISDIRTEIESGNFEYSDLLKFINDLLGLQINKNILLYSLEDLSDVSNDGNPITSFNFSSQLDRLVDSVKNTLKSEKFIDSLENATDRKTQLDSSVSKYISGIISVPLFNAFREGILEEYTVQPVMNATMANGNSIPSFVLPNMTYKDTELFELQRKKELNNPRGFKSLLLNSDAVIDGTLIRLEVTSDNRSKPYDKLTPIEQFNTDFVYEFLKSIKERNKFSVIIGNYSDKSSIPAKIVNANVKITGTTASLATESIENILKTVKNQAYKYYKETTDGVFREYSKLFNALGIRFNISENFEDNVNNINNILSEYNLPDLLSRYADLPNIQGNELLITEDQHYSFYNDSDGNRIIRLNDYTLNNYRIFSNDSNFNEFVKKIEDSVTVKLANYYNKYDNVPLEDRIKNAKIKELVRLNEDTQSEDKAKSFVGALGLTHSQFTKHGSERHTDLVVDSGLNPYIKKWLWTNALIRNEYLFISTKGEYMHPHKIRGMQYDQYTNEINWDSFFAQMSGRLSSMGKRNVTNTSTIETPVRHSKEGIGDVVNTATIDDYRDDVYLVSNINKKGMEVFDGSSSIDDSYARMLDASFPGKGYFGTRKQFGTLITPNGVSIKKDAESVITNDKIRNSFNSTISLLNKKKQMLSIPIGDINIKYDAQNFVNYMRIVNGQKQKISDITIDGNMVNISYINAKLNEDGFYSYTGIGRDSVEINTLYELWDVLGGLYTMNPEIGDFDERSNEVLYDIIINNPELKSKIIHVISNKSSIKAGATNLNSSDVWTNDSKLLYTEYDSRFMGPQLDASHDALDAEIREVSQVMSSLSQNGNTSELAQEVYQNVQTVIQTAMNRYLRYLDSNKIEELSEILSDKFIDSIKRSDRDEVTNVLINTLKDQNVDIPFSNQNFYDLFVRQIITTLNDEFITRRYSGLGAVLVPSHGMFQIYDVPIDGETSQYKQVTQADLMKEVLINNNVQYSTLSNAFLINSYINRYFSNPHIINSSEVELGDIVHVNDVEYNLNNLSNYYKFKKTFLNVDVQKVLNKPRDLKPTLHSFTVNGQRRNVFDFTPVKLLYKYLNNELSEKDLTIFTNFVNQYVGNGNIEQHLRAWTQRLFQLLNNNLTMSDVDVNTDFSTYFGNDNILVDTFNDVKTNYNVTVDDVRFRKAEMVMSDIYKNIFDRDAEVSVIEDQKDAYFKNKLQPIFDQNTSDEDFELKLYHTEGEVYVRIQDNLPPASRSVNIKNNPDRDNTLSIYNGEGRRMYDIPRTKYPEVVVRIEDGKEIIYIKNVRHLQRIISSFDNVTAIIPKFKTAAENRDLFEFESDVRTNNALADVFQKFYKVRLDPDSDLYYNSYWFEDNKDIILDLIAKTRYTSWLKSREFIASRIPAQSKQSFMPMKNVAYMKGSSNDVYVNITQLLLTGGDFDIDKAYMLGYGFNENGVIDIWSDLSNFTELSQLNELLKLPLPTGKFLKLSDSGIDLTLDYRTLNGMILSSNTTDYNNLPAHIISKLNTIIRKVGSSEQALITVSEGADVNFTPQVFIDLINRHNLTDYIRNRNATKNSIVSGITNIISNPSSQMLANIPVDVQQLHDAIETHGNKKIDNSLNSYDILSFFEQQYNASIGKDDVGIMANGMKVFFALTSYYNDFFKKNQNLNESQDLNYKLFNKRFTFIDVKTTKVKEFQFNTISDVEVSREQVDVLSQKYSKYKKYLTNAALTLSALTSAATDNAKELIMDKINATTQLASMHVYMTIMGFELSDIVEIMTSDVMSEVVAELESNIYESNITKNPKQAFETVIKKYVDMNPLDVNSDNILISNASWINANIQNLRSLLEIYINAQELTALSGILGVNQKRKADTWEIYKFLNRFGSVISSRETEILGTEKNREKLTLDDKVALLKRNSGESEFEIIRILNEVEQLNISNNFDIELYQSDPNYKKVVKDYYNLLKGTFNIFDVIDNVPHFKQMVEGVQLSHRVLQTVSAKYNFIYNHVRDENIRSPRELNKGAKYFDVKTITSWLKSPEMGKYTFDLSSLLKLSNKQSIEMNLNDNAMNDSKEIKEFGVNDNFIISLDSDYGIANFKIAMEKLMLPILQANSNMGKFLRIEQMNNAFGLRTDTIVSNNQLKYLNNPISISKFQEILTNFNSLDENIKSKGIIKNVFGESLNWKDLLYIYNLTVNNDLYGDKRLTPLFRDYAKEPNSLLNSYLKHVRKFDSRELNVLTLDLINSPEYINSTEDVRQELIEENQAINKENIHFYINNNKGTAILDNDGMLSSLNIKNPNFVLVNNVSKKPNYINVTREMNEILKNIELKGFIIDYNC